MSMKLIKEESLEVSAFIPMPNPKSIPLMIIPELNNERVMTAQNKKKFVFRRTPGLR